MSDLPEDLVEEILCRVPATSVKQLRLTCKRWNNLFNNTRFTRKHLDKAPKQFLALMLKQFRVCLMSGNLHGIPFVDLPRELSLIGPQFEISEVSHCDGFLLCTNEDYTKIVVWNPCTGQTRWIQPRKRWYPYTLGSYRDNKSGDNSYKVLRYCCNDNGDNEFEIYEINSNSWRSLDVSTLHCEIDCFDRGVFLKGKTYWFASDDEEEQQLGIFLVSFDYTTERFERLPLPCQCFHHKHESLSVVREEKLSVLLQHKNTSRIEIWVTNKIDESTVVSWSMVLAWDMKLELDNWYEVSFLVDEEKKVLMCCNTTNHKHMVYIVGEDNKVKPVNFGFASSDLFLINYVPRLTQIRQGIKGKRKRVKRKRKRNQV